MDGCFDGICEFCKGKVAWIGAADARPDCPHCGKAPSEKTVNEVRDLMLQLERVRTMNAHFDSGAGIKEAREFCGLSLKQAARALRVSEEYLARIECDNERPSPQVADNINKLYRTGF